MVRVLICDDQTVVRDGLAAILSTVAEVEVVGMAANGEEALSLVAQRQPNVVLMDLNMPVMNGVQATRLIREHYDDVYVLVLTTYADDAWLFDAVRAGATGYILKDTRRDDLVRAIEDSARGKAWLDPDVASKLMAYVSQNTSAAPETEVAGSEKLTNRELEVLRLIARGRSNTDIAKELQLSTGTVRNYVSEILGKLSVSDRIQAALYVQKHQLL
ncbi:response regulator transcription factor [Chloroflexi bacterium TSY]|nr:response regulator transcription factor [Chloroflexi bacterium TSY]